MPLSEHQSIPLRDEDANAPSEVLEAVLSPVAETMGYEVLVVEWGGSPKRRIARVFLDAESGVSLDDCARMGRVLSNALDAAEGDESATLLRALLANPYTLEVSSPGVERPLVKRPHFERFVGERVKIKTRGPLVPGDKQRTFHGHIQATEPDPDQPDDPRRGTVVLRALDGDDLVNIPLRRISRANLVYV